MPSGLRLATGRALTAILIGCVVLNPAAADENAPLPETAYDGGVLSAETLGRGNTYAAAEPTGAVGSQNPSSLAGSPLDLIYTSGLVGTTSKASDAVINHADPLNSRVLQYLSLVSEKGVLYYEPLGRLHTDEAVPEEGLERRSVDFTANAIGFAGAAPFAKKGQLGVSVAYLWSSLHVVDTPTGAPAKSTSDTANGFRLNIGARYPTGPVAWGGSVQNAPAFLWGDKYRREMLPIRLRVGNSWRVSSGLFINTDFEKRFYQEGGHNVNTLSIGADMPITDLITLRAGVFGPSLDEPETRHVTSGITVTAKTGLILTYALDSYRLGDEKVNRSYVSLGLPFETESDEGGLP